MTPVEGKYWRKWREACAVRGWKSSDSPLRHAMHQAADCPSSHTVFRDPHWDRIFPMIQRCADPDDLDVVLLVEQYRRHDAAQAVHEPTVRPGSPRRKNAAPRGYASRYERLTGEDDPGERKRLCYVIGRLFEPRLIDTICFDRWEQRNWRELPLPHLTELRDLLKSRLGKWLTKVKQGKIAFEFPFSIANTNPRGTSPFLPNEEIIALFLKRGVPVHFPSHERAGKNEQGASKSPNLMEQLRALKRPAAPEPELAEVGQSGSDPF